MRDECELEIYLDNFVESGFDDTRILDDLTDEQLIEMGIEKKGHRKLILRCIQMSFGRHTCL